MAKYMTYKLTMLLFDTKRFKCIVYIEQYSELHS